MSQVDRQEFVTRFDVGVPLDQPSKTNDRIVIMYNMDDALPRTAAQAAAGNGEMPLLDVNDATANCDIVNMVLVQKRSKRQCKAFVCMFVLLCFACQILTNTYIYIYLCYGRNASDDTHDNQFRFCLYGTISKLSYSKMDAIACQGW